MNIPTWRNRKRRALADIALLDAVERARKHGLPQVHGDLRIERIDPGGLTHTLRLLLKVDQDLADLQNARYQRDQVGREERP